MRNIAGFRRELAKLKKQMSSITHGATEFILLGKKIFSTMQDPTEYIRDHGAIAPDGRRIIGYKRPADKIDAISQSVYEYFDECIQLETVPFMNGLKSDEIPNTNGID